MPAGVADADAATAGGGGGAVSTSFAASAWLIGTKPAGPSFSDRSVAGASKVDSHASTVGKVTSAPPLQKDKEELSLGESSVGVTDTGNAAWTHCIVQTMGQS